MRVQKWRAGALALASTAAATAVAIIPVASTSAKQVKAHTAGKTYTIAFEEPLGGQPWREMGLATLQNIANQAPYKGKFKVEIVRTQNNDPAQQLAAMRNLVAQGVSLIMFDPASQTAENPAIQQAEQQHVPVMAAGGPVDNTSAYEVSTDWNKAGILGARWLVKTLKNSKNKDVALLQGYPGVPLSDDALPGIKKTLAAGGLKVVALGTNDFDEVDAQKSMASILSSHSDIGGVQSFLTGGVGIPAAFKAAGRKYVPTVGGSGYNGEACTLAKDAKKGLTGDMVSGQPAIYAKAFQQAAMLLEGKKIPKIQLFAPLQVTTATASKYCLKNKPALFAIGYSFPGLNLPLATTLKYYRGQM